MVKFAAARQRGRFFLLLLFAWLVGIGLFHTFKPLPPGLDYRGKTRLIPARDIDFLADLTYEDPSGGLVHKQQIFDEIFSSLSAAERHLLLDMFLFNSFSGSSAETLRDLAGELAGRLAERKKSRPGMQVDVVTDPINTVYGGGRSAEIDTLREAGVNVVLTNLKPLRDSNPGYSSFWRAFLQWFGNSDEGGPLPHPFADGEEGVTLRSYLRMLNFKANHRKVLAADNGSGAVTIISSANPHDASSAHSNVAFRVRGDLWRDVYETEKAVAGLSGGKIVQPPNLSGNDSVSSPGKRAEVVLLTERHIKTELLQALRTCSAGDAVWVAMFYLSDRDVIAALLEASARGAGMRIILDPNRDAFGFEKNGIPNRQTAWELREKSGGSIAVRWYKTHGEQFHSKMVFIERADGAATAILGSANLTRRNLDGYNLELDVSVTADRSLPPMTDIRDYLERIWENRDGTYTVDFEEFADDSTARKFIYRFQEFTGLCSY